MGNLVGDRRGSVFFFSKKKAFLLTLPWNNGITPP